MRCGPQAPSTETVAEPVLIAEVLSPSTSRHDQTGKWRFYQRLPSLRSYLLVERELPVSHLYRRSGAVWTYSSHAGLAAVVDEPACSVRLAELYAGIDGLDDGSEVNEPK